MIERLVADAAVARSADIARILSGSFASETQRWDRDSVAGTLGVAGTVAFLAPAGPAPAACAILRIVADQAEILTVAVLPSARRQGLGGRLVQCCLAEAAVAGAVALHLEVARSNAAARAVYRAAGFAETGRRPRYYATPQGREDAVLMGRDLADLTSPEDQTPETRPLEPPGSA